MTSARASRATQSGCWPRSTSSRRIYNPQAATTSAARSSGSMTRPPRILASSSTTGSNNAQSHCEAMKALIASRVCSRALRASSTTCCWICRISPVLANWPLCSPPLPPLSLMRSMARMPCMLASTYSMPPAISINWPSFGGSLAPISWLTRSICSCNTRRGCPNPSTARVSAIRFMSGNSSARPC